MTHDDTGARGTRRATVAELAGAVRELADAVVETGVDLDELAAVTAQLRSVTEQLARVRHDGTYSGLHGRELDLSTPAGPLPLSPIVGDCNPSAPDVHLTFAGGRVRGTARLTKRHIGPPGAAHGGIGAMLADQLVAVTPYRLGRACVTRELTIRYRRPIPLYTDLDLDAWCEADGDERVRAWCTIAAGGAPLLEAEAELVTARHVTAPSAPPRPDRGG